MNTANISIRERESSDQRIVAEPHHVATVTPPTCIERPRLGFIGLGWIGRYRLQAVAESNLAEIVAIADQSPEAIANSIAIVPASKTAEHLEALLAMNLDGLVIATPNSLHASQATTALEYGVAVFCQKPLARTAAETQRIVDASRTADRLLSVDFSYRFVNGVQEMRNRLRAQQLGRIFAIDLVFHNAYGPDKSWFYDPMMSGGGCILDLGVHLVDIALWLLDYPEVRDVRSTIYHDGMVVEDSLLQAEDYAVAEIHLESGVIARLACSWRLSAGRDAVIEATVYGTQGSLSLQNVNGSFYDLAVEHRHGTTTTSTAPLDNNWGRRAITDWVSRLKNGNQYDPASQNLVEVAGVIDRIYRR
jgi:predicted dehydrogenase